MAKKITLRMCTGCGEKKSKKELIRILKTPDNEIVIDVTGKKNGRGAYICSNISCFNKAVKSKGLNKSLKVDIPNEILVSLEKELIILETGQKEGI